MKQEAHTTMFAELGTEDTLLIATDGSFCADKESTGWGFAVFYRAEKIAEEYGAHTLYTSSTRMEVEAVHRALSWLANEHPDAESVIIATDSMALLSKVQAGWMPDGWISPSIVPAIGRITWTYVPGHAGVLINEEADRLASAATAVSPLKLYDLDIVLLGMHQTQTAIHNQLSESSEGTRLLHKSTKAGCSSRSHRKGPDRCRHNQTLGLSTLQFLLSQRVRGEDRSASSWMHLLRPLLRRKCKFKCTPYVSMKVLRKMFHC